MATRLYAGYELTLALSAHYALKFLHNLLHFKHNGNHSLGLLGGEGCNCGACPPRFIKICFGSLFMVLGS